MCILTLKIYILFNSYSFQSLVILFKSTAFTKKQNKILYYKLETNNFSNPVLWNLQLNDQYSFQNQLSR